MFLRDCPERADVKGERFKKHIRMLDKREEGN
jgi:hypothetical protein